MASRPSSVARRLSAIRQLYRFLYAEGHRGDDPSAVIEGPKRGRALPKVLSIAEVDRLLAQARAGIDPADRPAPERLRAARLACLIEVLYATGLRVSELVALPVSAAERNARMLTVRGKGNKERLVPLNEAAKTAMREYLALLSERSRPEDEMAFSLLRRSRPPHAPAFRPRTEDARRRRRPAPGAGQSARSAPRLRQPSSAQRRRSAGGADACSAMPTSPRHKSTPMCWPSGSRAWCATCTRSGRTDGRVTDFARRSERWSCRWVSWQPSPSPPFSLPPCLRGSGALAQTPQERRWCEGDDAATAEQRLEGCSAVIKAGRDKGEKLAEAFNNRGVAYRLKGEYDRAIQDYNQADQARSQIRLGLQQSRRRLRQEGRVRPRHPRLRAGHQAQAFARGLLQPRQRAILARANTITPSTTITRRSSSNPISPPRSTTAAGRERSSESSSRRSPTVTKRSD